MSDKMVIMPISKLPQEMKDGRIICLRWHGIYVYCRWLKGAWRLGEELILGANEFCLPRLKFEEAGSGI